MARPRRGKQAQNELQRTSLENDSSRGMSFSGKYEERRYISELPDPDDLAKLEALNEGTVAIILRQYEAQAEHRRTMEAKVVGGNVQQQNRGPIYGMVLVLAAIGCGTYLIATGRDAGGLATIITALAAPVAVFVGGRVMQFVERRDKRN